MRVLHLLDVRPEFEHEHCSNALADSLAIDFAIIRHSIGHSDSPGGTYRNTPTAAAALRRLQGEFDFVHAFCPAGLTAAALGTRLPILFSPPAAIQPATVRWLRAISRYRLIHTIAPTATLRRILIEQGIAPDRIHLIRPGVDFSQAPGQDSGLRRSLGFSDEDRIILAVGESTRPAAHADAAWVAGILHVANPRYKLLLWNRGPQAGNVQSLARRWKMPRLITLMPSPAAMHPRLARTKSTISLDSILSTANYLLITARGPVASLSIASAMSAARPIVSTDTVTTRELLKDHHTALMAPPHQPRALARRILDLEEDPGLAWKLADTARAEAYERFSRARFFDQFRMIYRQIAEGTPIERPSRR